MAKRKLEGQLDLFGPPSPTITASTAATSAGSTEQMDPVGDGVRTGSVSAPVSMPFIELVREQIIRDSMALREPYLSPDRQFYIDRVSSFKEYLKELEAQAESACKEF